MTPRGSKSRKEIIRDDQPGFFNKSMLLKEKEKKKKEAVQLC